MKISTLFTAYNTQLSTTSNSEAIFSEAGMTTDSAQLKFGFFPLGSLSLLFLNQIKAASIFEQLGRL